MEQKNTLPESFFKMVQRLQMIEKAEEQWRRQRSKEELLRAIWENWPRKTVLNKEILQIRGNALKNPEVKAILNKYQIQIEDCALVVLGHERHYGDAYGVLTGFSSSNSILENFEGDGQNNAWLASLDYFWGGPKDPLKILFKRSANSLFKVVGVIQMFLERGKKAA